MSATSSPNAVNPGLSDDHTRRRESLAVAIEHAGHLLPAQGPITVFIHHNTLHAFEDLPFEEAVIKGGRIFGCHPYLPEAGYRERLAEGRIRVDDLRTVLQQELGPRGNEQVLSLGTRLDLRMAMLEYPLRIGPAAELRWFIAETDALSRIRREAPAAMRERLIANTRRWIMHDVSNRGVGAVAAKGTDGLREQPFAPILGRFSESAIEHWSPRTWEAVSLQLLWRVCHEGVASRATAEPAPGAGTSPLRLRDVLLEATGADSDMPVHELMIRFCATFLDQGFGNWQLPMRERGFFESFCVLYGQSGGPPDAWLRGLPAELERIQRDAVSPLESILESLEALDVREGDWDSLLSTTLLSLRGWAGMVRQIELRADRVARPIRPGSLVEFLAVQLLLERFALAHLAREWLDFHGPLRDLREVAGRRISRYDGTPHELRAFQVFQLAQVMGWSPDELHRLSPDEWKTLVDETEGFSGLDRRRVFHLAFERRYRTQTLDALACHSRGGLRKVAGRPRFQAMFCLDEREESMRRHLEELAPEVETFGVAGFYSVAMYYQGAGDARYIPLCPVVVRPQHWVAERVVYSMEQSGRRRAMTRRALGRASHQVHVGSRQFASGTLLSAGVGVLASVPLLARILFPRLTAKIRRTFTRLVAPPKITELQLERTEPTPGPHGAQIGFSVEEMANIGERLLRDAGLTTGFSRLVLILGHGSSSLNNPHNSAYNCGACGGSAGGPNARAVAQILNDIRIRDQLSRRGLVIPGDTVFVGGMHNTCDDSITYFDLDELPHSHRREFEEAVETMEDACDRNAHERCRRFQSAPLTLSFDAARMHVEERSEDLAQTRPECGHASNAFCVVGRRGRTRGLYLDRRSFLVSYDATQDDAEGSILTRLLQAAVPVCAGINLEYYFSYVDSTGWGCGTKLPHNVTALLGVMDGAASDLRTGLPWQMVEIHEPVRLMFVIETTPAVMRGILDRHPALATVCRNGWVQLATLDPESGQIHHFDRGEFRPYQPQSTELPKAASSTDWYRGWRDNLEFAQITG